MPQEATPATEEFMPEGVNFEPVAFAPGITLPTTGDVIVVRFSLEPGAGLPLDESDPSTALAVIESGELTIRLNRPLTVTRDEALGEATGEATGEAEAGGEFAPATEEIAAGQEVTLQAGDTALFPPNVGGEFRNDGQERVVALAFLLEPPLAEATPTAGTPSP